VEMVGINAVDGLSSIPLQIIKMFSPKPFLLALSCCLVTNATLQPRLNNGLALTPPLGYVMLSILFPQLTEIDGTPTITTPAHRTNRLYIRMHKLLLISVYRRWGTISLL
jgi:hypothetical protein